MLSTVVAALVLLRYQMLGSAFKFFCELGRNSVDTTEVLWVRLAHREFAIEAETALFYVGLLT